MGSFYRSVQRYLPERQAWNLVDNITQANDIKTLTTLSSPCTPFESHWERSRQRDLTGTSNWVPLWTHDRMRQHKSKDKDRDCREVRDQLLAVFFHISPSGSSDGNYRRSFPYQRLCWCKRRSLRQPWDPPSFEVHQKLALPDRTHRFVQSTDDPIERRLRSRVVIRN